MTHCDVLGECSNGDDDDHDGNKTIAKGSSSRILTVIYYLGFVDISNHEATDAIEYEESFGGELKILSPDMSKSALIEPAIGNLLIFNSKVSRHSVQPLGSSQNSRHRLAITLWYSSYEDDFLNQKKLTYIDVPPLISPSYDDEAIFVSIPSLNDADIWNTIKSIYLNASCPARVFVGLCAQYSDSLWSKLYDEEVRGCEL